MEHSFPALSGLPLNAREVIQSRCFAMISYNFMEVLAGNLVQKFNATAIKNLENDYELLEDYAEKTKISDAKTLMLEMRQLLNLLLAENMEEFLVMDIRRQKYNKLFDLEGLLKIMEKYKDEARFLRKGKREKSIEAVIMQLKKELHLK